MDKILEEVGRTAAGAIGEYNLNGAQGCVKHLLQQDITLKEARRTWINLAANAVRAVERMDSEALAIQGEARVQAEAMIRQMYERGFKWLSLGQGTFVFSQEVQENGLAHRALGSQPLEQDVWALADVLCEAKP